MEDVVLNHNNSESIESDNEDLESEELDEIEVEDSYENSDYPKYNPVILIKKIIEYLMSKNILLNKRLCTVCNNIMNLNSDNSKKDGLIWRCKHTGYNKHDIKCNIRNNSIFEQSKSDIRILFFIIFYNFIDRKSVNQTFLNCKEFSNTLNIETISQRSISKFMNIIRIKIMKYYHNMWNNNQLGIEPDDSGKSRIEVDESKIVTINNEVRWMLGLTDRATKEVRIFYLNNDRTKDHILPFIKKNVYTFPDIIRNNIDEDVENPATRIYTDSFQTYQVGDFNRMGFILHRINHSISFGQGINHTNTIEGVWSRLKRLCDCFNGLNGNQFYFNNNHNCNDTDYFNGYICAGIFFMDCEKNKLGLKDRGDYLIPFIKC